MVGLLALSFLLAGAFPTPHLVDHSRFKAFCEHNTRRFCNVGLLLLGASESWGGGSVRVTVALLVATHCILTSHCLLSAAPNSPPAQSNPSFSSSGSACRRPLSTNYRKQTISVANCRLIVLFCFFEPGGSSLLRQACSFLFYFYLNFASRISPVIKYLAQQTGKKGLSFILSQPCLTNLFSTKKNAGELPVKLFFLMCLTNKWPFGCVFVEGCSCAPPCFCLASDTCGKVCRLSQFAQGNTIL
jgi:hypothetical protein